MKLRSTKSKPRAYTQGARAEAAEATAQRIVEAFLARLTNEWFDEITLAQVAEDAGVTVQTVIRRFGGKEGLLTGSLETLTRQINARRESPSGDVDAAVAALMYDYETVGDAVLRLLALEARHPALSDMLNYGRGQHRGWIGSAFSVYLANLDTPKRTRALDALTIVTDVYTWKLLRRDKARSLAAATAIMQQLVRATLNEFTQPPLKGDKK